jgi:hypothetical protein
LLALVRLFDALEDMFIILRVIVTELHAVLTSKLSGENFGEIASLFKYIAMSTLDIAVANYKTEDEIAAAVKAKTEPINTRFQKEEKTRATIVSGETDIPTNLAPNTYG